MSVDRSGLVDREVNGMSMVFGGSVMVRHMEENAPTGIRTRVATVGGLHDTPTLSAPN